MKRITLFFSFLSILLAGCSSALVFSDDVSQAMMESLDVIQTRDIDALLSKSISQMKDIEGIEELFVESTDKLPDGISESKLISTHINSSNINGAVMTIHTGVFELTNNSTFALVELALQKQDGKHLIRNVKITSYESSPSRQHDWNWMHKSILNYLFLALTVFIPIFILISFISCWRNKNIEKKWRWRLFVLFGLYGLSLNWTTGEWGLNFLDVNRTNGSANFSILKFNLFGASVTRPTVLQPWILEVGFPLGAVLYWWKNKRGDFSFRSKEDANLNPA